MNVGPPGVSDTRLRVSIEWIRVAIIITPRRRRLTLLIGIEAAIAHGAFVAIPLDAERVIPGSSGVRHHSGRSDGTNREGCQEKIAHHSISSIGRQTARLLRAFPPVGNKVRPRSTTMHITPLRLIT